MILNFFARYQKFVALFLLGTFYAQFALALHIMRATYGGTEIVKREVHDGKGLMGPVRVQAKATVRPAEKAGGAGTAALSAVAMRAIVGAMAAPAKVKGGGPSQPEMQAFTSVNANNMVDLFSGDFSYNIPLLDVGGYPVNLSYRTGSGMDDDASWVGLGWNINPGSITRNMRGLPDDFDGGGDTVRKVAHIKPNKTWGVSVGASFEIFGLASVDPSLGLFHNTYNGWGMDISANASISVGSKTHGAMTGGLSLSDNSQNGVSINPSIGAKFGQIAKINNGGVSMGTSLTASYNSRSGLKSLSLGINDGANRDADKNKKEDAGGAWSPGITFAGPTYNPTITMPTTNQNYTLTVKVGGAISGLSPDLFASGYVSNQYVANSDTALVLPAFGYLNYQDIRNNWGGLTDFNREKEIPYREKPAIPHIAVPSYTYDVFTINGEGTGGMFRAYRGDVGFVADHLITDKSISGAASVDLGVGDDAHSGIDLNANYATTTSGPWLQDNTLKNSIGFTNSNGLYENAFFRNPGEKAINNKDFYTALGGDDVVTPSLFQRGGTNGATVTATNTLLRENGQKPDGTTQLTPSSAIRDAREKRNEVITYLTAKEASVVGLDKYIYRYALNQFTLRSCENDAPETNSGNGSGLMGSYYNNPGLNGAPQHVRLDPDVYFNWDKQSPFDCSQGGYSTTHTDRSFPHSNYSATWRGSFKPPVSGNYMLLLGSDDGSRIWIDDSLYMNTWYPHGLEHPAPDTAHFNLVGGHLYNIRMDYFQAYGYGVMEIGWRAPGMPVNNNYYPKPADTLPTAYLYPPVTVDTAAVNAVITREDRVNNFRQSNHISEINVLNPDGRRYVYGIPVYNLQQKEVSFATDATRGSLASGETGYTDGVDNTTANTNGKDGNFSKEQIPAYAHSFLLTAILSPDYVDVTGDGVSDDDLGDAVKFNYTKTAGIDNPMGWRAPYNDSASYAEGARSYSRDDKGHYIYGTKELWYLNSIESKTMIATFTLQHRSDLMSIDEHGNKTDSSKAMCLKEIDLYSKADFLAHNGPAGATPIKTIHFEYNYQLCPGINRPGDSTTGKLTLQRIWFTYNGNDKGALNPYVFHYHNNNPIYTPASVDKWGTYKPALSNPGSSTSNLITNEDYPYALQDSTQAAYNAAAWALDSIELPSGAKMKVNYESDDYAYVQNRRATQMCKLAGFATINNATTFYPQLYTSGGDMLYAYINVPYAPTSVQDIQARYFDGISKLYFRMYLQMPADIWGSGYDFVPAYSDIDTAGGNWCGMVPGSPNMIWVRLKGVNKTGDGGGSLNPIAETAVNWLRLNLPDKAYPGSEVSDDLDFKTGLTMIRAEGANILELLNGFSNTARYNGWVNQFDTSRSFVRLDCPTLKKYGGGHRVKSILIHDNWHAMTNNTRRETVYGQTYDYTTTQTVNGVPTTISSGVASWEPSVGAEENPFHLPIEYVDRASVLAPAASLYTEEPLGESFYPGASVGYSRVRVRSIHGAEVKSASGFSESKFYTTYDFPTTWDYTMLDNNTKKRWKPLLSNFLRINVQNMLTFSQGFKVELNDMNGRERSTAVYAQTDSVNPISYTENFYKVDNPSVQFKHLNNTVSTIDPYGNIDTTAIIGKDMEVMTDMREQTSQSVGGNINLNTDMFQVGVLPTLIPDLLNLYQHEVDRFRSVAMVKIIQRYGILDSVVHIDKGSKISTKNMLYDSETGDALLTRTQNEFNDPVYNFSYPAHWMYNGAGLAYQNIDAVLTGVNIQNGKIVSGLSQPDTTYLTPGDELLVYSRVLIGPGDTATFPDPYKLWVIDTNLVHATGPTSLYLVDQYGVPFNGNYATIKVTRSGHRNLNNMVGSVTSLGNPLRTDGSGNYHLVFDSTTAVVAASASELQQLWRVADRHRSDIQNVCSYSQADSANAAAQGCACLRPLFDYLLSTRQLFIHKYQHTSVRTLVLDAIAAGKTIDTTSCPILSANLSLPFYALTFDTLTSLYQCRLGNDIIDFKSLSGQAMAVYQMVSQSCDGFGRVVYKNPAIVAPAPDTVTVNLYPYFTVNLMSSLGNCPFYLDTLLTADSTTDHIMLENQLAVMGQTRNSVAELRFDSLYKIPINATILSAKVYLKADTRGHIPGLYDSANSTNRVDSVGVALAAGAGYVPYMDFDTLLYEGYFGPWASGARNRQPFQNDTIDAMAFVQGYTQFTYNNNAFVLTQGSGGMNNQDSLANVPLNGGVPPYLLSGYTNYYATFYNQHYADSTKWPVMQVTYIAPQPALDTMGAVLVFNSTVDCNTVISRSCYSAVTDTLVNPYQYGILGDFRPSLNYVYYTRRTESDPTQPTNIRKFGTIVNFAPFWVLNNGNWGPVYDTTRWVWNTQSTLYNQKGYEIENRDPLGRFNSGLYGYGLNLPVAVTQNARVQETAYEGFEDYGFITNTCDTVCPESRPFDFSAYQYEMSDSAAHTGLYSLRVPAGQTVSISAPVQAAYDLSNPSFKDTASAGAFAGQKAVSALLPPFEPYQGKRMLVSTWVKESVACTCQQYTNDHVSITFTVGGVSTSTPLHTAGNIIEGWQRYDTLIDIPAGATNLTLSLAASGTATTYFDDIRIQPFNAEMKSYVYNPISLRLMAELDENNYATFYEYDDDGTLIRVKKETERGILTIKETRSALLKNN
ncbi:PA14 domain-containing protein [Dinghuibacter silviterrae]|uniref:PA14 domain-containing protein n=1 Tax=Dinghuibacter silviterrae TaxID=1539049 RepID=A0A4R8DY90_9BACT|nr:PA14 domain-containing protein [Dinghuibacter silviterrae]TDX02417.1 PA14 domain-containing protein [Dinghuibacter silviterrae]